MDKYFEIPTVIEEKPEPEPEPEQPKTPTPEEPVAEEPKTPTPEPEEDIEAREEREYLDLLKVRNALAKKRKSKKDREFFKQNPGLEAQVLAVRQKKLKVTKGTNDRIKITEEPGIISDSLKELIQTPKKVVPEKVSKTETISEPELVMADVPKKEVKAEPLVPETPEFSIISGSFF